MNLFIKSKPLSGNVITCQRITQVIINIILLVIVAVPNLSYCFVNDLRAAGYSLIPAPQQIELTGQQMVVDESWTVVSDFREGNIAFQRLTSGAEDLFNLRFKEEGRKKIILEIDPEVIVEKIGIELAAQGYRLSIKHDLITITGHSETGLFYGVQSFLQLLRPTPKGVFSLPVGIITDWPDMELRFIHWDTKHHQDRIKTLKRYLDQAAFFKINAVAFEMEDKYEYPSHSIIGAPGAFTKAEMNELTKYALERNIELVPSVQAPSHMAFVLKHEEFAHLRSDGNNYHSCMCSEEAMNLIFDMYQDMIDATPGVQYFFTSTDEVYYAGICDKCEKEYNEENRSLLWVEYMNRVYEWMQERGRKVVAWVEYPLWSEHIKMLPSGLIDGIMVPSRSEEWIDHENKAGIKQLAYSSMQGAEFLFPNYFPTRYRNRNIEGRLMDASVQVNKIREKGANPIGTFAAAWDDAGLHNETFWLGWATVTQYGWTSQKPSLAQSTADFMDVFYGSKSPYMVDIYMGILKGARFYEDVWDKKISTERSPGYGNSKGKGIGTDRYDLVLDMPELPIGPDLERSSVFRDKYALQITEANELILENDRLISQLMHALTLVSRNRYNLEVLLSLGYMERYTMNTILNLAKIDEYLEIASNTTDTPSANIIRLVEAYKLAGQIIDEQEYMWNELTNIWRKSRFEKGRSVGHKEFIHVLDDVKDHFADRRIGLDYMLAPFQRMDIPGWRTELSGTIKRYAKKHNVPISGEMAERLED